MTDSPSLPLPLRWAERLTVGVGWLAAVVVVPLALATCYEVFARYIFTAPTIWAFELGYMLTGSHFLLGAAITLQRGQHIRIDLFYARLTPKRRAMVDLICYLLLFVPFAVFLSGRLWEYMEHAVKTGELSGQSAWNPPIWPFRLVFFCGFALLALQALVEAVKAIYALRGRPFGVYATS